jgi:hypothetical protein
MAHPWDPSLFSSQFWASSLFLLERFGGISH